MFRLHPRLPHDNSPRVKSRYMSKPVDPGDRKNQPNLANQYGMPPQQIDGLLQYNPTAKAYEYKSNPPNAQNCKPGGKVQPKVSVRNLSFVPKGQLQFTKRKSLYTYSSFFTRMDEELYQSQFEEPNKVQVLTKSKMIDVWSSIIIHDQPNIAYFDCKSGTLSEIVSQTQDESIVAMLPSGQLEIYYLVANHGVIHRAAFRYKQQNIMKTYQLQISNIIHASLYCDNEKPPIEPNESALIQQYDKYIALATRGCEVHLLEVGTMEVVSSVQLSEECTWIGFISYDKQIGLVCFTENHSLKLLLLQNTKLTECQSFCMPGETLVHINGRKLFLGLQQKPNTFSIFSFKNVRSLVLKSVQGFVEHSDRIISIDSSLRGKMAITAGLDQIIRLWTFKKILLVQIRYPQPLAGCCFYDLNGNILAFSRSGLTTVIMQEQLAKQKSLADGVAEQYARVGQTCILSMNDFFKKGSSHSSYLDPFYRRPKRSLEERYPNRKSNHPNYSQDFSEYRHNYHLPGKHKQIQSTENSFDKYRTVVKSRIPTIQNSAPSRIKPISPLEDKSIETVGQSVDTKSSLLSKYLTLKYKKIYNLHHVIRKESMNRSPPQESRHLSSEKELPEISQMIFGQTEIGAKQKKSSSYRYPINDQKLPFLDVQSKAIMDSGMIRGSHILNVSLH